MMPEISYSRVSPFAVTSAAAGIATSLSILVPPLGLLSIIGIITGVAALIAIRRYEVGGARLARLGLVTSVVFAAAGPLWQFVAFRLEAPDGYLRLSLSDLTRKDAKVTLEDYVEENVTLKGFACYQKGPKATNEFVLSVNGDIYSKTSDKIVVELPPGQTWTWNENGIAVSGTLARLRGGWSDEFYPKFKLTQAIVRRSLTRVGGRGGRRC